MSVIERFNLKVGDFQLFESPVEKHGTHDQKTHGSWAIRNFNEEIQGKMPTNLILRRWNTPMGVKNRWNLPLLRRMFNDYTARIQKNYQIICRGHKPMRRFKLLSRRIG
jgi:hypothetical protein